MRASALLLEKATHSTTCSCSRIVRFLVYVSAFHITILWSEEQLANEVPSALIAIFLTQSLCSTSVCMQYPVDTSHTLTEQSLEQDMIWSPEGVKSTPDTLRRI